MAFPEKGCEFCTENWRGFGAHLQPFFPCPQKNTPPKSAPILETFIPVVILGARHWFASLLLDASISMLTEEDL